MATSRLCVKNLPKYCDDARLRTLFSEKGEVTDVKVRRTRDGRSRQFAYVGFKRVEEAEAAQRFFDRSFIDTSRLRVEFAYAAKGESTPAHRPWSKYSKGSSAHERQEKAKAAAAAAAAEEPAAANGHGKHFEGMEGAGRGKRHAEAGRKVHGGGEDEPEELREFLQVMQPRSKGKLWTNDDAAQSAAAPGSAAGASVARVREARGRGGDSSDSDEDDALYQDLPGGGRPGAADDSEEEEEEEEEGAGKDPMVADATVSDMEYLRSRMTADLDAFDEDEVQQEGAGEHEEEEEEEGDATALTDTSEEEMEEAGEKEEEGTGGDEERRRSNGEAEASGQQHQGSGEGEGGAEGAAEVGDSGRLFVRNLPFTTTEAEIHDLFAQHGDVTDVHLVLDKLSKKGRGFGYVHFAEPQQAQQALEALDSIIFQGRLLHVLPAQDIPGAAAASGAGAQAGEGGSFKQQQEAERKRSAGNREAWNTMFMRQDTVAEAVAAHFGVTKRELLDPTSSEQAVRMALGETHVISKTKDCLLAAGVDVATLEAAAAASGKAAKTAGVARSATTLLVKNLPWGVTETELREMFSKCGALGRVVLPSTGTLALVEFLEPPDARQAFRSLAYKRLHHVPLYLEWAPRAIFSSAAPRPSKQGAAADAAAPAPGPAAGSSGSGGVARGSSAALAGLVDSELEDEDAASLSIYVKNLSFATGDAGLRKHFDAAASRLGGSLHSAKVAVKPSLKGKKPLSMGYGFVECSSSSVAKALVKQLQGSLLDGHKLVLQLASAPRRADAGRAADAAAGGKTKGSAKVLVRNLAFEATRKDLLGLFSPFGHVKSCRLPKKFDGSHRGFAFLEFGTKLEAKDAMEAAGGVHLYGRRLVLEYAKDEEGLDELRAKTAAKYRGEDGPPAKKART